MDERKPSYLTSIKSNSIVDHVVSRLTNAIIDGELKPGDQIPIESELASTFGVGRNTVREAVRILVAYGVLEIRRADGTYVCSGFSPKILDPMLYGIILQKESAYKALIGLRQLLDNGILQILSAADIPDEVWETFYRAQREFEECLNGRTHNIQQIVEADIAFHCELAKAADNIAILTTYNTIVEITKDFLHKTIKMAIDSGEVEKVISSHREILEKLAERDMNELYQTVEKSYSFWFKSFENN